MNLECKKEKAREYLEYYFPDLPWYIIKSYNLTFNRKRVTKSAKLLKNYFKHYNELIEDNEILPDTTFSFVYFYSMMKYRQHFNYAIFPFGLNSHSSQ